MPLSLQQHSFYHSRFHFINILFITPASISATFFSSLPLPFQQHSFHYSRFHFRDILFITSAFTSATFFHYSRSHFSNILFITPTSISATLFSSFPLPLEQHFICQRGTESYGTVCCLFACP